MKLFKKPTTLFLLGLMTWTAYKQNKSLVGAVLATTEAFLKIDRPAKKVRGVAVSQAQLDLAEQLGVPANYVNYKVGKRYIDIALVRDKIAIEYNGAIWHKDKAKDISRAKELTKRGWRVLIIQVYSGFPDINWVKEQVKQLKSYKKKKILYVKWRN